MAKKSLPTAEMLESGLESEDDFAAAYEAYRAPIFRFLFWRTQDHELSGDLTSTVFEKAWKSRTSFHGGSVQAWLYRIARNTLTDHWRRPKELAVEDMDTIASIDSTHDDGTAERLDAEQEFERLGRALEKLPVSMRNVVELRFIQQLPVKVVAERLQMSEGNVRIIQYRALKEIRKQLL